MSWIGGSFVMDDLSEKSLKKAYASIRSKIRHEADLEEFPNMGNDIMPIKEYAPGKIYDSFDAAKQVASDSFNVWNRKYNATFAFYDTSQVKTTKKLQTLETRLIKEKEKLNEYVKKTDCSSFKAELITCPNCKSKINKKYIYNSHCPLCRTDLRSKTVIDTTNRYRENIKALTQQIREEKIKQKKSLPVKYYVEFCEYVG